MSESTLYQKNSNTPAFISLYVSNQLTAAVSRYAGLMTPTNVHKYSGL